MRLYRVVPVLLLLFALPLLSCADAESPMAPGDMQYARGGVPGAPDRGGLLTGVPVTGQLENGEAFAGTLRITEVDQVDGALVASGVLSWMHEGETVSQAFEDVPATLVAQSAATAVSGGAASVGASCDILLLDLGPIFLDLLGLQVDLSQIVLDIDAVRGAGRLLGNLLCAVTGLLDGVGLGNAIANLLDRINDILDDIGGLLAGTTGALADGGTFTGDVVIESIERTAGGALEVTGVLNGTATLADGTGQEITGQAFTVAASLSEPAAAAATAQEGMQMSQATCDILLLDIAPIFLDLLGLQVDLSQVVLDIDAVSGANNLLGNLLCAVTGLLDGFALLDGLLARINDLLGALG
ncbi:MAG TPA: hypothetical protein VF039_09960 [Longimicrobiales bacterium]